MNRNHDHADLDASLKRLGIRELEERMEVAPLLADMGGAGDMTQPNAMEMCCVCKIPNPFGPDGNLPYPTDDPTGGVSTGPTNPGWNEIG